MDSQQNISDHDDGSGMVRLRSSTSPRLGRFLSRSNPFLCPLVEFPFSTSHLQHTELSMFFRTRGRPHQVSLLLFRREPLCNFSPRVSVSGNTLPVVAPCGRNSHIGSSPSSLFGSRQPRHRSRVLSEMLSKCGVWSTPPPFPTRMIIRTPHSPFFLTTVHTWQPAISGTPPLPPQTSFLVLLPSPLTRRRTFTRWPSPVTFSWCLVSKRS